MNKSVQHFDSVNTTTVSTLRQCQPSVVRFGNPESIFLVNLLPSIIVINIIIIIVDVVLLLFSLL